MNSTKYLLAATLVGGLLSSAIVASASDVPAPATLAAAAYTAPAPVKVVSPTGISRRFEGQTVHLRLTVDATGRPHHIYLRTGGDDNLVKHLLPAVAQWRFTPATRDGRPVAAHIELPVELVDLRTL